MATHILFETASGYALFEHVQSEAIGNQVDQVQQRILDAGKFGKMVKLKSFSPFKSALDALENQNDISEGVMSDSLKAFLELNLASGKKSNVTLGVEDKNLAGAIKSGANINCASDELVHELCRGIRFHASHLLAQLKDGDLERAQLGLGHAYSRAKVKFNVHRADNMIIQAIALLDQLDKDVNTFCMRVREWYSWHFPELVKVVNDNILFAKLAKYIGNKSNLDEGKLEGMAEILGGDEVKAKQILDAARSSMGTDISEVDLMNIENFATRVVQLAEYRSELHDYLRSRMHNVAPNLSALIGEIVGARLISHAGSLTNLSKYPASTVQILGAEKALFRALKTRGNTPKYGLIYHSTFIGRAGQKNKGRISRFLANKCSIASRIDCFTDTPTTKFGEALRKQVEDRLEFYEHGGAPSKNAEVMEKVLKELAEERGEVSGNVEKPKKKKKSDADDEEADKKKKKRKEESDDDTKKVKKSKKSKEEGDGGEKKKKKKSDK